MLVQGVYVCVCVYLYIVGLVGVCTYNLLTISQLNWVEGKEGCGEGTEGCIHFFCEANDLLI